MPPGSTHAAAIALLASLLALASPYSALAEPVAPCQIFFSEPADGATSVPLDVVVSGEATCPLAPVFTDDTGQTIAADMTFDGAKFQMQPDGPLLPDRMYTVAFASVSICGPWPDRIRFRTGGSPGVREVQFVTLGKAIHGIDVHLSEPVLVPADLAETTTLVSVTVDGFSLSPKLQPLGGGGTAFQASYKNLPQQPTLGGAVRIRLHQGLRFASGKDLAADVVLTLDVPGQLRNGMWRSVGSPMPCAPQGDGFPGCRAVPTQRGGSAWLLGLGVLAIVIGRRQRLGRCSCAGARR